MMRKLLVVLALCLIGAALLPHGIRSEDVVEDVEVALDDDALDVDIDEATFDSEIVEKEERVMKYDGLSADETKNLQDQAETHEFQAEVSRMMKLIINSLYKNKDIFLRELISNASDALDKIRFLSLTDSSVLGEETDLHIKIHVDKENKVLHITDTGIGMTKADLVTNLGTIAKSGTNDFIKSLTEGATDAGTLIGQFGVGFYSAFLVADTVVVTSKHNDDKQYIWTSDASSFSIVEDPREDEQLGRGTRISLYLKDEAMEFLENNRIRDLIHKYSEFINFDIFLYTSKQVPVEADEDDADEEAVDAADDDAADDAAEDGEEEEDGDYSDDEDDSEEGDDEGTVDDEEDEDEEDTDSGSSEPEMETVWDWEVINANKPIWTRNAKEVEEDEYNSFYKSFSKDTKDPISHVHFKAEGEISFRSILFIPSEAPQGFYNDYGAYKQSIKMYVRRVFITDEFEDLMPKYLAFIKGVVDSDDLPLNVSRETLQQHKLLKVIKKKLVRKALDMIKKLDDEEYKKFWKQFGTSIKLGLMDDFQNRTRLAKLLRFWSSHSDEEMTSLLDYVERMKKNQEHIFFVPASSKEEAKASPFVERLLKRGYEVIYLTEPVDEYAIQNLPEFEEKKFQNVAKEGLEIDNSDAAKELLEGLQEEFKPLTDWMDENLSEYIEKAEVSTRLSDSPCALVASRYGMSGRMEQIMKAQAYARPDDPQANFYRTQKKILELNPRHPLIKNLLERTQALADSIGEIEEGEEAEVGGAEDETLLDTALVLLDTARLRSGFALDDSVEFAARIERMLRSSAGVALDAQVDEEPELPGEDEDEEDEDEDEEEIDGEEDDEEEIDDEEEEADEEEAEEEESSDEGADDDIVHEEL